MAKAKRNYRKEVERGDITVEAAASELRKEILEEVRHIAGGYKQSIYELVEMGKELEILKVMIADSQTPKTKGSASKKVSKGGIKPIAAADEIGEEDF